MNPVLNLRRLKGLTQAQLATAAGTSQPTIAAYEAGRKSPTLRTLERLAGAVGLRMTMMFHPPLTREERRSLHLHEAIALRLRDDPDAVLERARRNLELMLERHPGATPLLREWKVLLERPLPHLLPVLTDPGPRARELRQVTPFAGILTASERAEVYGSFTEKEAAA